MKKQINNFGVESVDYWKNFYVENSFYDPFFIDDENIFLGRIYDSNGNFIFQLEDGYDDLHPKIKQNFVDIINNVHPSPKIRCKHKFIYENGLIKHFDGEHTTNFILIRGWGNLISPNCFGLSDELAIKVQDTLGKYIVDRLTSETIPFDEVKYLIDDETIKQVFDNTNFGKNVDYRELILNGLKDVKAGYAIGNTLKCCLVEIGLIKSPKYREYILTPFGKQYIGVSESESKVVSMN